MSLMPIERIAKCPKCGHKWVTENNTLDLVECKCPKCRNIVIVF